MTDEARTIDGRRTLAYQVFFRASPVAGAGVENDDPATDDDDWRVGWFDEIPADADVEAGSEETFEEIGLFLS